MVDQDRKVSQMHNMSMMSHLSVDPAAMAQASMIHNLDMSSFGVGQNTQNNAAE